MGQDKAGMEIAPGITLLQHMVGLVCSSGAAAVWVSGRYAGFDCVGDEAPELGPLAGLHAALHRALREGFAGLLIVPIDMPALTPGLLRRLSQAPGSSHFLEHELPAFLRVSAEFESSLGRLLAEGPASARSVRAAIALDSGQPLSWDPVLSPCFRNLNTPQEWRDFHATVEFSKLSS
jgi:molybdopterin-guanine dinucleotide biosynthesis protein A